MLTLVVFLAALLCVLGFYPMALSSILLTVLEFVVWFCYGFGAIICNIVIFPIALITGFVAALFKIEENHEN